MAVYFKKNCFNYKIILYRNTINKIYIVFKNVPNF